MRALLAVVEASALAPKSALEVAAGDASLSAHLATTGCRVAANDLRKENLEQAVRTFTNGNSIRLLPGNMFELDPSETGLFDLVIACEVIEHVAHADEFLRQLKRFVAPGGRILLTTPNGSHFRNKLPTHSMVQDFNALEAHQFKPDADGHLFLITPEEMAGLSRGAGLAIERILVWGTPLTTGHAGLARFSNRYACWLSYYSERLIQKLPKAVRNKFCFAFSVVLKVDPETSA